MAPNSASMDPYSRAAFLAAQIEALRGPEPAKPSAVPEIAMPQSRKSKEKPAMSVSPASHAKSSLRARKPAPRRAPSSKSKIKTHLSHEPSFERHRRKCRICCHPQREAIEELFIHWHSPESIHHDFAIYPAFDVSCLYRHARAADLYKKRSRNLRDVFDLLLEQAGNVLPTAHGIVAVVRAYSCLTKTNQWVEPERRVHIVNDVHRHDLSACPDEGRAVADSPACPARPDAGRDEGRAVVGSSSRLDERRATSTTSAPDESSHVGSQSSSAPAQLISRTAHISTTAPNPQEPNVSSSDSLTSDLRHRTSNLSNRQPARLEHQLTHT
jgi:hypothetical protein